MRPRDFLKLICGHSFAKKKNVNKFCLTHTSACSNVWCYMHALCGQLDAHSGASLPFQYFLYAFKKNLTSPLCPGTFLFKSPPSSFLFCEGPALISVSELNAFPSHVFCNSIKLFSLYWQVFFSFSFSSEKKMQWFCSCVSMLSMKISARKLHYFSWTKNIKERFGDLSGCDHSLYWPNNETAHTQSLQKQNWTTAHAGKLLLAWDQELVDMVIISHHIQHARKSALFPINLCRHRALLNDTVRSGHSAQWRSSTRYRNTWWLLPIILSVPHPCIIPPCSTAIAALLSRNCFSASPKHKEEIQPRRWHSWSH